MTEFVNNAMLSAGEKVLRDHARGKDLQDIANKVYQAMCEARANFTRNTDIPPWETFKR